MKNDTKLHVLRLFSAWLDIALLAGDEAYEELFAHVMNGTEPHAHDGWTAEQIEATTRLVRARQALRPDCYGAVQPLVEAAAIEAARKLRTTFST